MRVTLPLPLLARVGARYRHLAATARALVDVELNVAYETWSRVQRFTVDTHGLDASPGHGPRRCGDITSRSAGATRWR